MLNTRRFVGVLTAAFLVTSLVGCGDDAVSGTNNDNNRPGVDTPVPAGSKLTHTGDCAAQPNCAVDVTFNSSFPLKIQLRDGNNNPVFGARIQFDLTVGEAVGTTLNANSTQTNDEGFAEVTIRGAAVQGVAEVVVSAPADATVSPIKFVVGVSPKDSASYRVSFTHAGNAQLKNVNTFLYASDVTCAQIREDLARERDADPATNPVLTAESTQLGIANIDGTLPLVVFPGLANNQAYTVAARSTSRANSEVEAAFGCQDGNPPILNGNSVNVVVNLIDHLPRVAGAYDVTNTFSITDAICNPDGAGGYDGVLPGGVCLAIDLIGRLATDPASFLLGEGNGDQGLIGLIVDFLPDNGLLGDLKGAITSFLNNGFISGLGRDALNGFFESWINDKAPSWVKGTVDITGDIYESLKEFKVSGVMRISKEPDASFDPNTNQVIGILAADAMGVKPGKQVWEDITVFWTGACAPNAPAACRERTFSAGDLGATSSVIEGFFTGSVVPLDDLENPGYGLVIDEHTLTLNYGVLILGIIEQVVLPSIFGQNVTSIDSALNELISLAFGGGDGCEGLGQSIADAVGGGDTVKNIGKNLCNNLLASASDGIRSFLTENLTVAGEDNFLISTPDGKPCRLLEPTIYSGDWTGKPLPYIEDLGSATAECDWEVKIKVSASEIINTAGTFSGRRTSF